MENTNARKEWPEYLSHEDVMFIKRFVLASGSLKELARVYGVSYPTVRLRLDRVIERIRVWEEHQESAPFERQLAAMYADGRLSPADFRALVAAYRQEKEDQ